jgi:hypothetical protein
MTISGSQAQATEVIPLSLSCAMIPRAVSVMVDRLRT